MKIKQITLAAMMTALCAVCAWITVPFAVPFTMQTFAVFLTCLLLGGGRAAAVMSVYLLIGAMGVPVFSGFSGGVGVLTGPTGGYLIGFIMLCGVYAVFIRIVPCQPAAQILGLITGLASLYLFGTLWFVIQYTDGGGIGIAAALLQCVIPFILPDLCKLALAFAVAVRTKRILQRFQ